MSPIRDHPVTDLRCKVQHLLEQTWGDVVELDEGTILTGRNHIHRFQIKNHQAISSPPSIVVKEAQLWEGDIYDPNASTGASVQLCNDWAALEFLREIASNSHLSPRVYAGDREQGFIVMEDVQGSDPVDALQSNDREQAEQRLVAIAKTLGQLHALTSGHEQTFQQRRDRLGQRSGETDIHGYFYGYTWLYSALQPALTAMSLHLGDATTADLQTLVETLEQPGPFQVFTHGDPCPDNFVYRGESAFLVDFERGAFRHACLDIVYGRMALPTCWCAQQLPDEVVARMETAYRVALSQRCPAANDDAAFYRGMVAAAAYWTLSAFQRYDIPTLVREDSQWGLATLRQRLVTRSQILIALTEQHSYLEALGSTIATVVAALEKHWSPATYALPFFTAFHTSAE